MTARPPGPASPAAVVFDLDGVLIESEHLWEEMWTRYAARSGVTWTAEDTGSRAGDERAGVGGPPRASCRHR